MHRNRTSVAGTTEAIDDSSSQDIYGTALELSVMWERRFQNQGGIVAGTYSPGGYIWRRGVTCGWSRDSVVHGQSQSIVGGFSSHTEATTRCSVATLRLPRGAQ